MAAKAFEAFITRLAGLLPFFLLGSYFLSPFLSPLQQLLPIFILVFLLKSFVEVVKRK